MANLLKKKGRYYLQFYDQSCRVQRKTISLKTSNKATALTLKAYHEAQYALGKWSPWESPQNALRSAKADSLQQYSPTVAKALEAFLESRRACRKATVDHYSWVLSLFVQHLSTGELVEAVTSNQITSWVTSQATNPTTRRTYLSRVGIFLRWCQAQGWTSTDPTKGVTLPKAPDKLSSKLITPLQVQLLETAAQRSTQPYLAPTIRLGFDLALRLGEVCALKWSWIDLDREVVIVKSDSSFSTKSGREVVKPLSEACVAILKDLPHREGRVLRNNKGRPLTPKHTSKAFKRLVRQQDLPEPITFHSLRHGALSTALSRGASVEAVRRFAGHATIEMTMRYLHLQDEAYLNMIRKSMDT